MATYWENSCSFGLRYVSWYKYLIVSLFFSHLGFWSGNLFLIAPFPDLCLLVPFDRVDLQKSIKTMVHFIWPVMTEKLFSLPLNKVDIHFGHVRMYAMPYPISWIIFILDSELSYIEKLMEFRWIHIAPLS